jgi:hypothetical protein
MFQNDRDNKSVDLNIGQPDPFINKDDLMENLV